MELGFPVDLYTHSLQSATRAHRDGADDEMTVCALLHDIGEMLCPSNHGDVAASILRPYIGRKMHWVLANHEVFQGYYYFDKVGLDKNARGAFGALVAQLQAFQLCKVPPEGAYELCIEFCEKYDMNSFDPDYLCMELSDFQPMLLNVFSKGRACVGFPETCNFFLPIRFHLTLILQPQRRNACPIILLPRNSCMNTICFFQL